MLNLKESKHVKNKFQRIIRSRCTFWSPQKESGIQQWLPYVFMERNGIHIIDLNKTVAMAEDAASAMKQIAKSGKNILFVATKKQAKNIVAEKAAKN